MYMPQINSTIEHFKQQQNNHPLTSECNYSPLQLWVRGMIMLRNSGYTAVNSIMSGDTLENYGVEEDESFQTADEVETSNVVIVPESPIVLDQTTSARLQEVLNNNNNDDSNGIHCYLRVRNFLIDAIQ